MRAHRSPLAQTRRYEQVLADALAVERERADGVGDALDAFALQGIACGAPAEQQRREEQADLVDLAGVEEGAREVGAALQEQRGDAELAELIQGGAHARRLVLAG